MKMSTNTLLTAALTDPKSELVDTCIGAFYFGKDIPDFVEFVHDIKSWCFGNVDYPYENLLFQPNDRKLFKFMNKVNWDEMHALAMYHLPYRFRGIFDDLDIWSEARIAERLLMLSGDVETNPGPVFSRPLPTRNNDPRAIALEKVKEKQEEKVKTLIRELRRDIKYNRIYPQGLFDTLKDSNTTVKQSMGELNSSLSRVCDFLEHSLPFLQKNMQMGLNSIADKCLEIKDDLIKILLICLIVRLLMIWKKYRMALIVILAFVFKFYGFDQTILDLITELRLSLITAQGINETAEEVIYHPYFAICGKIIFAVIAFVCIKKIPGKQDWDNYITRLDRIPKAVNGASKIYDYCSEYFNLAMDQVKMMVLGKTREEFVHANGLYNEIHEWASDVHKYLDLEQRGKIDTDIIVANKVEDLYRRGVKYQQDTLLDKEMARLVAVTLQPARELYQYVSSSPVKGGGPRMRPICLWLIGESGVGKTEMVYPLCIDVLRAMGFMRKEAFHHQVYGRQVETEYWDGYKGQKIVIYDDAFQMKDDKTSPNPEIFEVIRSCNTFPQHLHMAALHDKNTFSAAELMIYTTNDANVKLESITFPDAFYNRIGEHAYRVRPKLEYSKVVEQGKSGNMIRKLDKSKLNKDVAIDLSIYEFQKIVRDNGTDATWIEVDEPIGYEAFAKLICDEWREKKDESRNKLKFLEEYAVREPVVQAQVAVEGFDMATLQTYDYEFFVNDIAKKIAQGEDMISIESDYAMNSELFENYLLFKNMRPQSKWDKYRDRIQVCLDQVGSYLNRLKEASLRVLREHPFLSSLGIIGLILSAFSLYKMFEQKTFEDNNEIVDKFVEVGCSGDEKTVRQTRKMVEIGNSGDVKTSKLHIKRVEVGVSGDTKTPKNAIKRVEGIDEQLLERIESQGCSDMAAHSLITDVITKNTYRLSYFRNGVRKPFGNCTFLRGWVFAIPYHFLHALHARRLAPETIIYFSQSKYADIIQIPLHHMIEVGVDTFSLTSNCVQLEHRNGEARDCVLVNLHSKMCHPHRDILKHFVRVDDQGKLQGRFSGTLVTFHENGDDLHRAYFWLQHIRALDKPITIQLPNCDGKYEESYTQRDCYEYNAPTQVGDCGSLIGIYNNRLERKIIGIHIAGSNETYGYACPLTQEVLEAGIKKLVQSDIKNISAQIYFEAPKEVDVVEEPDVPEGLFCPIGKSSLRVGQAVKTSILPSRIHGLISKPFMKPALLKPKMINGQLHNPLLAGLKKCGVHTAILDDDDVYSAASDVYQLVSTQYNSLLYKKDYQRILTYEEAVQGVEMDSMMNGVSRSTSPGYPYNLQTNGMPGKTRWMGANETYDFSSEAAQQLRKDVEALIEDCKLGKISNVVFIDTLKDERRDIAKVDIGKTRVFSAGPQHFVVAFRKYFLPFAAWLMHNRIDNEVAVGTNPYSLDWERISRKLKLKGDHVIAGDFGNFDGSLVAQVLWSIFWDVYVPWLQEFTNFETKEGLDNLKVCLGLWTHLVHSVHIYDNNVYMWTHSQPSGNPFTVIINCLYNSIIMRVTWLRIMHKVNPKLKSMKHFRQNVSMVAYGDDNVLNISPNVIEFFNQETISVEMKTMKHEYTDETKSGDSVKFRKLEEVSFLKRSFRFCPELQRTVAPLKIEVIYEMLNWTRNTVDPDVILMANIDTAFREIVYHGREEYERLRTSILKITSQLPYTPQILSYKQYLHDAEYMADEIYEF